MYKFIALVWNEENAAASRAAAALRRAVQSADAAWETAYSDQGLAVFHAGEIQGRMQAIRLKRQSGVILGKIFTSPGGDPASACQTIGEAEMQRIIKSDGRHLVTRYWGRYIAFLQDEARHRKFILKAPIEGFYCYNADYQGVTVYFSSLEDFARLGWFDFMLNWSHIATHLHYFRMDKADTAFHDLHKLQPGECHHYRAERQGSQVYWSPADIYRSDVMEDPAQAACQLRETVMASVSAWAGSYGRIIHKLSGGLDSSIVLACLRQCREAKDITALNYHPAGDRSGDERAFARQVAGFYGVDLIEKELLASNVRLEGLFDISPLATPELYMNAVDRCGYEADLAGERAADVLWAGEGGDGIFFQPRSPLITSDYIHRHGFTPAVLSVALDNARLMKKSLWAVLYEAAKVRLFENRGDAPSEESGPKSALLNYDVLRDVMRQEKATPPSFAAEGLPKGKRLHISLCALPNIYCYSARPADFLEVCYPLLSQPIIECCLRIPSYILTTGARDRGLARMAFKDDLPPHVLRRESKGGIQHYAAAIVAANRDFIREILLDGILREENLLNRRAVARALDPGQATVNVETVNILRHVCTEIWLRKARRLNIGLHLWRA